MSNQPASLRRDKIGLGHSHLQLAGNVQAQRSAAQRTDTNALGARADVTQITNITTGVSADGRHGNITTVAVTTASGVSESAFTLTNKYLADDSVIILNAQYGTATQGSPVFSVDSQADGSCDLILTNAAGGVTPLDGTVICSYMILGAAPDQ